MPDALHVKALIRSHAEGDDERFYSIASQLAAEESRLGHEKFARELLELIEESRRKVHYTAHSKPIPIAQPQGELAGLLIASYPKRHLSDLVLGQALRDSLTNVLVEQRQRETIRSHGYEPIRKLLLLGPPGTGKTMTAGAIASELGLALFTIQIDGLITKYLGETAAKLRLIFQAIGRARGVYFFDEFDALGGERAAKNDVGEIRRVLNSFLQFLEQDESDSVIIAATNHPSLLDRALFRRFDGTYRYRLPTPEQAELVMRSRLAPLNSKEVNWKACVRASKGLSHADITRACEHAAKKTILDRTTILSTQSIVAALKERKSSRHDHEATPDA